VIIIVASVWVAVEATIAMRNARKMVPEDEDEDEDARVERTGTQATSN
jgi:carbon starvation protein